jgi:hypothetical protein
MWACHCSTVCSSFPPTTGPSSSSSPRPSTTLNQPMISSIDMVEMLSTDSIETTIGVYFFGTTHRYLATTFLSSSGSPRISISWTILVRRRAKSSSDSPSWNAMLLYCHLTRWVVAMHARSEPRCDDSSLSQAALAEGFNARETAISNGTRHGVRAPWPSNPRPCRLLLP